MKNYTKNGFQLTELLITMFIISLLVMIGLPAAQEYLIQVHRAKAISTLFKLATEIEKYGIEHNSYQGITIDQFKVSNNNDYVYQILLATDNDYSITAVPIGTQAEKDDCGALILNSIGEKKITGQKIIHECF